MLDILHNIEVFILPHLLRKAKWKNVLINYRKPNTERVWTQFGKYGIYLHRIRPCKREEALFYPHPCPAATKILSGSYKMDMGYGKGWKEPPVACTLNLVEDSEYEITDHNVWHRIYSADGSSISFMLTGSSWTRLSSGRGEASVSLNTKQKIEILGFFRNYYPHCITNWNEVLKNHLSGKLKMSFEELEKAISELA